VLYESSRGAARGSTDTPIPSPNDCEATDFAAQRARPNVIAFPTGACEHDGVDWDGFQCPGQPKASTLSRAQEFMRRIYRVERRLLLLIGRFWCGGSA